MSDLKYTKEHEWIRVEGDTATCGISNYAQEQLGDVVYVEVPGVGMSVDQADEIATIEVPVRILRAQEPGPDGKRFTASPTAPDLASKFHDAQDIYLPDATHFIPMESPSLVAGHLGELIAGL